MKIINTKLHGLLDLTAAFMLVLPWLSDYYTKAEDTWLLALAGTVIVLYSIFTDYEYGIFKFISMKVHLVLDALVGLLLIALPFIFPMDHYFRYWPVVLGAIDLLVVILSLASKPYVITHRDLDITWPA